MTSYFDLQPQKARATSIEQVPEDQRKQLGRMSLMSPAVTQILEGLGDERSDSSSEEEADASSEEEDTSNTKHNNHLDPTVRKHFAAQAPRPSSLSPCRNPTKSSTNKGSGRAKVSSSRATEDNSAKSRQKQPQMERFHSLRSMLFQTNIQDRMKTVTQEDLQKEQAATNKWRDQHEERQMHRPKTPEKESPGKGGIGSRIKMKMRRMTTKDVGGMEQIREDGAPVEFNDRSSTASSNHEDEQRDVLKDDQASDNESIDNSDVEDLVRWVSRRDSASDGEARKGGVVEVKEDSGHESLDNSDVDDLVRYASRRSVGEEEIKDQHSGYSDASTESDSELQQLSSDDEEDTEDLVRWVSHRAGPNAGPVRRKLERRELDSDVDEDYDSDIPELGRWVKRHDGTSGESTATTPVKPSFEDMEEAERGRPRSRESELPVKEKRHMTYDDVDELVRWVSNRDMKHQATLISASTEAEEESKRREREKERQIGMSTEDGSSSQIDVQDLVALARKTSGDKSGLLSAPSVGVET
ncbi:hypothetical protein BDW02DRAFT_556629 [Decorospora gaudefroyi]|uniref:Uncharacterized protein n=1 Tax=Decorospora gaudefroyi TaxID=184978 RepID=A0A6A5K5B3_9PLEO|nr:hypothetical protein BDW02DRAFT_556629 [Decorospora gaudefroyi]